MQSQLVDPYTSWDDFRHQLEGVTIVYFGNDWTAENRTSSHHIAARLMNCAQLLYIDSPGLRAPNVSPRDFKKIFAKLTQFFQKPTVISESSWRCTVPQIPFRRIPGVSTLNQLISKWAVKRALRLSSLVSDKLVLWFAVPHPGFLVGRLGETLVVYYCIDDYGAHPGVDQLQVSAMDLALTRAAHRVFVAPPALFQEKQSQNTSAIYSPHGVDVELFAKASMPETQVPLQMKGITTPVIGYFGSIASWIDIDLLIHTARSNPDFTLVLVGHVSTDVEELRKLPNVMFVGPKPYSELPSWAKCFTVAVIPYLRNQQVLNANPLKLREYLATGKPIVSVSNPEIEKFSSFVNIASSHEEFSRLVRKVVLTDTEEMSLHRRSCVKDMTWDARVKDVLTIVTSDLASRS